MKKMIETVCLASAVVMLAGCGGDSEEPVTAKPQPINNSGELRVMTGEDMEKFREERQEMIERSSPLNEEHDPTNREGH